MERGSSQVANKATLNLILGVFLKLLGFFVVMYTYTDTNPTKARQAEESLRQQFNISVSLMRDESKGDSIQPAGQVMQKEGRSYIAIREELASQLDFLSASYRAETNQLILQVPAEYVLALDGQAAKSPRFASILTEILLKQRNDKTDYALEIIAQGNDTRQMTRALSVFVQKMVQVNYPSSLMTIGYESNDDEPMIEFRVTHVARGI